MLSGLVIYFVRADRISVRVIQGWITPVVHASCIPQNTVLDLSECIGESNRMSNEDSAHDGGGDSKDLSDRHRIHSPGLKFALPTGVNAADGIVVPDDLPATVLDLLLKQVLRGLQVVVAAIVDQADDQAANLHFGGVRGKLLVNDPVSIRRGRIAVIGGVGLCRRLTAEESLAL
jgi:hypothetical protein